MRTTAPFVALSLSRPKRRGARAPAALAVGELVYDKLPQAGERTAPPSLAARLVAGALAGGLWARALAAPTAVGAATGALAALASTFVFHRLRAEAAARVPPLAAAAAEDLLAIGTSAGAVRLRPRRRRWFARA
jgi:uncharacterized membrane protein